MARRIAGRAQVVFVSAYDDQALAAFDAGAVDYVLKPVRAERLAQAVQRRQGRCRGARAQALLTQLDEQLFWQVHRSVIVNHGHIQAAVRVDEGQMHLTLRGRPETLPVSRHFQGLFKGQ